MRIGTETYKCGSCTAVTVSITSNNNTACIVCTARMTIITNRNTIATGVISIRTYCNRIFTMYRWRITYCNRIIVCSTWRITYCNRTVTVRYWTSTDSYCIGLFCFCFISNSGRIFTYRCCPITDCDTTIISCGIITDSNIANTCYTGIGSHHDGTSCTTTWSCVSADSYCIIWVYFNWIAYLISTISVVR